MIDLATTAGRRAAGCRTLTTQPGAGKGKQKVPPDVRKRRQSEHAPPAGPGIRQVKRSVSQS